MNITNYHYITLDSMGVTLDNVGNVAPSQIMFLPEDGSIVFNPSQSKIVTYHESGAPGSGTLVTTSEDPDVHTLYLNALSHRLYSWNGTSMMELFDTSLDLADISNDTNLSQAGQVYHVKDVRNINSVSIGAGSTVVFLGEGKFVGTSLSGSDIQFVPNGDNVCFGVGCSFANLTINATSVCATNFGAVPDMTTGAPHSWSFYGLTTDIQERSGTNNLSVWAVISSFLSNSTQVSIEFNGDFFSDKVYNNGTHNPALNYIPVTCANNLEVFGGTVLFYLELIDCEFVHVHHMSYVGHHLVHDFPLICNDKSSYINDHPDMENNCYNARDGLVECGFSGDCIRAKKTSSPTTACNDIHIEHCHFEMRQNGVTCTSYKSSSTVIEATNFKVNDCTFDHFYYQPIGTACSHAVIERIYSNYCLQGVDINSLSNDVIVRDSIFLNCACGPKQEVSLQNRNYTHDNLIENCYFQMNDAYTIINTGCYMLLGNFGEDDDTFVVRNCFFSADAVSNVYYYPIVNRSNNMLIDNCKFYVNIHPDNPAWKLSSIFCSAGSSPTVTYSPVIKFHNSQLINLSPSSYLAAPYSSMHFGLELVESHIKSAPIDIAIYSCHSLYVDSSVLDFTTQNLVQSTAEITVANSLMPTVTGQVCFKLKGIANLIVDIHDSRFKSVTEFLSLNDNSTGSVQINRNIIDCSGLFINKTIGCTVSVTQSDNIVNGTPT